MDNRLIHICAHWLVIEGGVTTEARREYDAAKALPQMNPAISLLAVRGLLVSAGVVSSILYAKGGDELRRQLRLTEHHDDLLKNRDVRDSAVHVDARFRKAVSQMPPEPQNDDERLMAMFTLRRTAFSPSNSLGGLRHTTDEFIIMGLRDVKVDGKLTEVRGEEVVQLMPLADAVVDVAGRARDWLAKHGVADPSSSTDQGR